MSGVTLRESKGSIATAHWLRKIAPDFAPPGYEESMRHARESQASSDRPLDWIGGHPQYCRHVDTNFWFWMWAINSGQREVHYHHHYYVDPSLGQIEGGPWGGRPVARGGDDKRNSAKGMSGGERVAAGAAGVATVMLMKEGWDYFADQEATMRKPLETTQKLRRKWEEETIAPQDRALHAKLLNVLKAQEKVEKCRVSRLWTYKWSTLFVGLGGAALVVGAILDLPQVVFVGILVGALALTIMATTWIISCFKDDTAPAKKVYDDYLIITTHFLAREIPDAPPASSDSASAQLGEYEKRAERAARAGREAASRREMAAAWAERAGDAIDPHSPQKESIPSFEELEARMEAIAALHQQRANAAAIT